jgi:hypothetical protein
MLNFSRFSAYFEIILLGPERIVPMQLLTSEEDDYFV